jgi:hypothetical protein
MKRIVLGLFGTAAVAVGIGACASKDAFAPIAITHEASVVASCQKIEDVKVEDVKADEKLSDVEAQRQLALIAKEKGANYLFVANESAREGTAYRCAMPSGPGGGGGN